MSIISDQIDLLTLRSLRSETQEVLSVIRADKRWGFSLSWETFILGMTFLPSQAYGTRIQNRLIKELYLEKVQAQSNNGDFRDVFGDYYELKVSILQHGESDMNMVQIRPWQKTHHFCFAFDVRTSVFKAYAFKLSPSQMDEEMRTMKAASAHGTAKANASNINVEYRMSLAISDDNDHFLRWKRLYQSNLFLQD